MGCTGASGRVTGTSQEDGHDGGRWQEERRRQVTGDRVAMCLGRQPMTQTGFVVSTSEGSRTGKDKLRVLNSGTDSKRLGVGHIRAREVGPHELRF